MPRFMPCRQRTMEHIIFIYHVLGMKWIEHFCRAVISEWDERVCADNQADIKISSKWLHHMKLIRPNQICRAGGCNTICWARKPVRKLRKVVAVSRLQPPHLLFNRSENLLLWCFFFSSTLHHAIQSTQPQISRRINHCESKCNSFFFFYFVSDRNGFRCCLCFATVCQ